jgi:MFS family permease
MMPNVSLTPYRHVLAVPGVRSLLLVGILARVPTTAIGISLTLQVANVLGLSWAQAGLATASYTVGAAVGQPITGRLLDRRGMRFTMALTGGASGVVWLIAPHLSYAALLVAAALGGMVALPVFSCVRLSLAAMVPVEQRRPAFALDSMIVELSFMVGPAVAVVLATSLPPGYGLYALAAGLVASGAMMWWLNPPTQPEGAEVPETAPSRRTWFSSRLVALMAVAAAATFVLSATELTIVASLRDAGLQGWTGLAIALWCLYSLLGGLVFGAGRSRATALGLVAAMAALTIPVGLADAWPWLLLALLPSGVLCAPSMTAANDNLARIVPAASRGEATGLLGSAFTAGVAVGAPFAGTVIDHLGPSWSYAATGAVGLLAALAVVPLWRRPAPAHATPAPEPAMVAG